MPPRAPSPPPFSRIRRGNAPRHRKGRGRWSCDFGAARWSRPSDQLGRMSLRALRAFLACVSPLLAKAHALLRARNAPWRSSGRPSGSRRAAPVLPVLLGGHVVAGAQVALQGLVLLAVEQRDQVVAGDGLLDRDGRLAPWRLCRGRGADGSERRMDFADQRRKLAGTELLLT